MANKSLIAVLLVFVWFSTTGQLCTKALVHGQDYNTLPRSKSFSGNMALVMEAVRKSMEVQGFQVDQIDEGRGHFESGWQPVEVDSHYVELFKRKDYGVTDGGYYKLLVDLLQDAGKIKVLVSTKVKSIAGPFKSDGKVERRLLKQITTLLQTPEIHMDNVEVKSR